MRTKICIERAPMNYWIKLIELRAGIVIMGIVPETDFPIL